jgi:hypothetical protein
VKLVELIGAVFFGVLDAVVAAALRVPPHIPGQYKFRLLTRAFCWCFGPREGEDVEETYARLFMAGAALVGRRAEYDGSGVWPPVRDLDDPGCLGGGGGC